MKSYIIFITSVDKKKNLCKTNLKASLWLALGIFTVFKEVKSMQE